MTKLDSRQCTCSPWWSTHGRGTERPSLPQRASGRKVGYWVAILSFHVVVKTVLPLSALQRQGCGLNQYLKQGPYHLRTPFSWSEGVTYLMPKTLKRTTRYTSLSWMRRRRKQCLRHSGAMVPCMCPIHRLNITDPGKNYPRRHGRPAIQAKGGDDRYTYKEVFVLVSSLNGKNILVEQVQYFHSYK